MSQGQWESRVFRERIFRGEILLWKLWTPTGSVRRGTFRHDKGAMVGVYDKDGVCLEDVPEGRRGHLHDVVGCVVDRKEDTDVEEREDVGGNVLKGEASRPVPH